MNSMLKLAAVATLTLLAACAAKSPFPQEVQDKVLPGGGLYAQFEAWRDASPSNGSGRSDSGLKLEFGGRIIQAVRNNEGVVVVAEQLPMARGVTYGPVESVERKGDYTFAFLYPSDIDTQSLSNGSRFVVVGTTTSRRPVVINGKYKTAPFMVADCIYLVSGQTHCTK